MALGVDSDDNSQLRSACERCRTQKLRCNRKHKNSSGPCARCIQAQAACVVCPRKAAGRPAGRRHSVAASQEPESGPDVGAQAQPDATQASTDSWFAQASLFSDPSLERSTDQIMSGPFDFDFDYSLHAQTLLDALGTNGLQADSSSSHTDSLSTPPTTGTSTTTRAMPSPHWFTIGNPSIRADSMSITDNCSLDPDLQLAKLQQNLTSHHRQLRLTSWDLPSTLRLDCYHHHGPTYHGSSSSLLNEGQASFDPLASTFRLIADFEQALSGVGMPYSTARARKNDSPVYGKVKGADSEYSPETTLSSTLTAVACYIQLVLIYNYIVSYVADQSANNRVVHDFILLSAPELMLGGQRLPPLRNFLGTSLVRLMKTMIRPVERVLGVPAKFRVSGDDDADRRGDEEPGEPPGLIESVTGASLLGVLDASLLSRNLELDRPSVLENLRAKMDYLDNLAQEEPSVNQA